MFFEFLDATVFPIGDGCDTHSKRVSRLLMTQSPTHNQLDGRLLFVRQSAHGRSKRLGANTDRLYRTPHALRITVLFVCRRTPKILQDLAKSTISVISLANEILTHSIEITHRDVSSFEIIDPKQRKEDFLHDI